MIRSGRSSGPAASAHHPARMTTTLPVTVTFLEMTARPATTDPRPTLPDDARLEQVVRPSVRFYRYLYDAVGREWLWWERRLLDDDALAAVVQDPRVVVHVLTVGGEPLGYVELDFRTPETPDLALFGVVPEATGRRFGPAMMARALDIVWSRPETRAFTVNTCTLDHTRALGFYRAMGFVPVRTEDKVIPDPRLRLGWADGPGRLRDASPVA